METSGEALARLAAQRKGKQDKKNKNRKYGRKARTGKHKLGLTCGMANCRKLLESRVFDTRLKAYVPR